MNEWSILDWATRIIGIGIIIRSCFSIFSNKVGIQDRSTGRTTPAEQLSTKSRNILRVAGGVGLIIGTLMIIYGGRILDLLFPW
ncbi:hypothetical protein [Paenibacillus ihuae]|uniref:hypothetical protein n=1 Tax=Paenibacillus ihuae TaxID=1232431 RepID=UPI000B2CEED6|nr:hypothetical protein [Paenibacillus ihuae]